METQTDVYHHHPFPPPAHHPPEQYDQAPSQVEYQYSQHQQPQSPIQKQPPARSKPRTFSFHSDRSRKSSQKSTHRESYQETPAQKESKRLHSKADPSVAISEAEPAEVAAEMTQSALAPLRSITHKDANGNPIADPDKSNPTRNRWERPLDTIRSFEAAIDGGYSRKSMMFRAGKGLLNHFTETRRIRELRGVVEIATIHVSLITYIPTPYGRHTDNGLAGQPRFRPNSYYGNRPQSYRPDQSPYDTGNNNTARNSIYDHPAYNTGFGGYGMAQPQNYSQGPSRPRPPRTAPEGYRQNGPNQNVYHLAHKDRSYETVTSAAGSGNSEPVGYQTDPTSSDNSSIERNLPAKRAEPINDYGIGFSQSQTSQDSSLAAGLRGVPQQQPEQQAPRNNGTAIPRKEINVIPRKQPAVNQQPAPQEKRKSWFARRFSKNS
ncbi:unnamed protein product [Clonostachys rosea]|uniref:DUF2406 domain-containing protein n=1 Tax=Bionectria ochroleuca TaxID=29856 RepID=A0ABY6UXI7_BIOOC|nr:unnamed protein product [Clonostachys rosea]